MNKDDKIYIFDTSALVTFIEDEDGSHDIDNLLKMAETQDIVIYVAFISLTELFYITLRERDMNTALQRINLIQSLKLSVVESYESLNVRAGELKANHRISLADSYIAALSLEYDGILVHKDPEFESLSSLIKEYRLPYKQAKQTP